MFHILLTESYSDVGHSWYPSDRTQMWQETWFLSCI